MAVWLPPLPRCVGKGGKQCPGREAEQTAGEYLVTAECVSWRVSRLQQQQPYRSFVPVISLFISDRMQLRSSSALLVILMMPHLIKCGHLGKEDTSSNTHNIIVYVYYSYMLYICTLVVDIMGDIGEISNEWNFSNYLACVFHQCMTTTNVTTSIMRSFTSASLCGGRTMLPTSLEDTAWSSLLSSNSSLIQEWDTSCEFQILWRKCFPICVICENVFIVWLGLFEAEIGSLLDQERAGSPAPAIWSQHTSPCLKYQISKPSSSFNQLLYCIF